MRTGLSRVETLGSVWMIDNDLRRYCRFPKHEGPREHPEWGGPQAGWMQDAVWHDFAGDWRVEPDPQWPGETRLIIECEWVDDGVHQAQWWVIRAPQAREPVSAQ